MKNIKIIIAVALCFSMLMGCARDFIKDNEIYLADKKSQPDDQNAEALPEKTITYHPKPYDMRRDRLTALPIFSRTSFQKKFRELDLRGYDIRMLEPGERINNIWSSTFDSNTIWPMDLPDKFDPETIMLLGKNPGLGIRDLHFQGITGKGIGVAVIGESLLVDHEEYKDSIGLYEDVDDTEHYAAEGSSELVSIILGQTVGVAPEAVLYYIAKPQKLMDEKETSVLYYNWIAYQINRITKLNNKLPEESRIRAIYIPELLIPAKEGYDKINTAIVQAEKEGIFVISLSLFFTHRFLFKGLGRPPLDDPDSSGSYTDGFSDYHEDEDLSFINILESERNSNILFVPMGARTAASSTGYRDYVFSTLGKLNWAGAYITGLYILACQVRQDITPQMFWQLAISTGVPIDTGNRGKNGVRLVGSIVNPTELIQILKEMR